MKSSQISSDFNFPWMTAMYDFWIVWFEIFLENHFAPFRLQENVMIPVVFLSRRWSGPGVKEIDDESFVKAKNFFMSESIEDLSPWTFLSYGFSMKIKSGVWKIILYGRMKFSFFSEFWFFSRRKDAMLRTSEDSVLYSGFDFLPLTFTRPFLMKL